MSVVKLLSFQEFKKSYFHWRAHYKFNEIESCLKPHLSAETLRPEQGWLRTAREALFLSRKTVALRVGISTAKLTSFEKAELKNTITLHMLQQVADAMGCELVYAIRPKSRQLYSEIIWEQLWPAAAQNWWVEITGVPFKKWRRLAAVSRHQMLDSKFRQERNWTQRKF